MTDQDLSHHGVKGMHWGIRKEESSGTDSSRSPSKKEQRQANKDWKQNATSSETANKAFQNAAKSFEPSLKIINNDANYKGKDLTQDRKLARHYDATVSAVFNQHLAQESVNLTYNHDTGHAYIYQFDRASGMMRGTEVKNLDHVKHADLAKAYLPPDFKIEFDDKGFAVRFTPVFADDTVSHGEDAVDDILAHYGVKGMHWGVKRSSEDKSAPTEATATQKKPGTRVRTAGGKNQPASEDAIRTAKARQKAKASTLDSLSNQELQDMVKRMQLEQNYSTLMSQRNTGIINKAHKVVKDLLGIHDTANRAVSAQNSPAMQKLREELDKNKK